jgi:hypothetical protein
MLFSDSTSSSVLSNATSPDGFRKLSPELSHFLFSPESGTTRAWLNWRGFISLFLGWWPPDAFNSLGKDSSIGWFYTGGISIGWIFALWYGLGKWIVHDDLVTNGLKYLLAFLIPMIIWMVFMVHINRIFSRIYRQAKSLSADLRLVSDDDKALQALLKLKVDNDVDGCNSLLAGIDLESLNDVRVRVFFKSLRKCST